MRSRRSRRQEKMREEDKVEEVFNLFAELKQICSFEKVNINDIPRIADNRNKQRTIIAISEADKAPDEVERLPHIVPTLPPHLLPSSL